MKLLTEAVREGERMGNRLNRWHLVAEDSGIGPVVTACGRAIDRGAAFPASRESIENESPRNSRVRRCVRCWA